MAEKITGEVVRGMVDTGLSRGIIETDFGPAVVRTALIKGMSAITVTFPDFKEKWAVVEGVIQGVKFTAQDQGAALPGDVLNLQWPISPKKKEIVVEPDPDEEYNRIMAEINAEARRATVEVKPDKKGMVALFKPTMAEKKPIDKPTKQGMVKNITRPKKEVVKMPEKLVKPKVDRPLTKVAKEKAKTGKVKEQPPTKRAYEGRPVSKDKAARITGTKAVKGQIMGAKVAIKVPVKVDKRTGPVPKIGPKPPKWVRQLGSNGKPEKVDLNLYPVKVVCAKCGQPRYISRMQSGITTHPVTLCKPCQARKKNDDHNAMLRRRMVAKREALEQEAEARLCKLADRREARSKGKAKPSPKSKKG